MAQESIPGTPITNTASVNFTVNGIDQAEVTASDTFQVDRRVSFTVASEEVALVEVTPGQTQVFATFNVTNTSNGPLDFVTAAVSVTTGGGEQVGGANVTSELTDYTVAVAAAPGDTPAFGGPSSVDNLGVGELISIRVYANVPSNLVDSIAAVDLSLTAADPVSGVPLEESGVADDKAAIDNVFANTSGADASGNATETVREGFNVLAANVTATKNSVTISDGLGNTDPATAKPIPGATVEYTITVENTGSQTAEAVVVTDTLDPVLVALVGGATGTVNGAACTVDDTVTTDGCSYDSGTNTVTFQLGDIASGGTGTATFQVTVL
jgi:uncharacterized repeat protein (TIGR01451 family)